MSAKTEPSVFDQLEPTARNRFRRFAAVGANRGFPKFAAAVRKSLWDDDGMNPERILKGTFLFAAFASFLLSVTIYFQAGDELNGRLNGIFVGIWVPSILALGAFVLAHRQPPK